MHYQPEEYEEPKHPRKRKRGGQPGNTNSLRHGFYSRELDPEEEARYCHALRTENLDPELIRLRIKFQTAIAAKPGDPRVIRTTARLMVRRIARLGRLNYREIRQARKMLVEILKDYDPEQPASPDLPEPAEDR